MTRVRFFAAAEEAAGTGEQLRDEPSVGALCDALAAEHPRLADILPRCAVLVDGTRVDDDHALTPDSTVDILPPFAGG